MWASFRGSWVLANSRILVPILPDLTQDLKQISCCRVSEHWTRDRKPGCTTDLASDLEKSTSPFWTSASSSLKWRVAEIIFQVTPALTFWINYITEALRYLPLGSQLGVVNIPPCSCPHKPQNTEHFERVAEYGYLVHLYRVRVKVAQSCPTLCDPVDYNFLGSNITADGTCSHEIKRHLLLGRKAVTNLDSILKSRDITLLTKVHLVKAMVFPVVMYGCELDYKESWAWKNWCFWTVVLEKTLESPLDCKDIQPVNPVGNQSRIFIGRTDAETPILWPPDVKNWLIGKDPDAGKDWRQQEERGWQRMRWLDGITNLMDIWASSGSWWWTAKPGVQQSWVAELDTTEWLNWLIGLYSLWNFAGQNTGV